MGPGYRHHRLRNNACVAALLAAGLALAGCSSPFGGASSDSSASASGITSMFAGRTVTDPVSTGPTFDEGDCPGVEIRPGASTLNVAAKANDPTANDLRYQLGFGPVARQCMLRGTTLSMRVGVEGRLIVGPAGGAGQVSVPLRYAVVQEGPSPKTIVTKFKRIPVTVPAGETYVPFTDIEEEVSFPLPSLYDLQSYVLYVGFDELGDRTQPRPSAKKAQPKSKAKSK
jgi:hypothetical protein